MYNQEDGRELAKKSKNDKINAIFGVICRGEGLCKNDVRKISGYSMSTVLSALCELEKRGLINIGSPEEKKHGRPPAVLSPSAERYVAGVSCIGGRLYAHAVSVARSSSAEVFCDVTQPDARGLAESAAALVVSALSRAGAPLTALTGAAISFRLKNEEENAFLIEQLSRMLSAPVRSIRPAEGMLAYYRWRGGAEKTVAAVTVKKRLSIAVMQNGVIAEGNAGLADAGELYSRMYSGKRAMSYNELLSASAVNGNMIKGRTRARYGLAEGGAESLIDGAIAGDKDCEAYLELLSSVFADFLDMLSKVLTPDVFLISGDYAGSAEFLSRVANKLGSRKAALIPCGFGGETEAAGAANAYLSMYLIDAET